MRYLFPNATIYFASNYSKQIGGYRMINRRRKKLIGIAVILGASAFAAFAQGSGSVTIKACYPDTIVPRDIANPHAICHSNGSLGNLYRTTSIGYNDITFPKGDLASMIISHGNPTKATLTFYLGDPRGGGIPFAVCTMKITGDFSNFDTATYRAAPELKGVDLSGTYTLWITFAGGGPVGEGCGNFQFFTFNFGSTAARGNHPNARPAPSRNAAGCQLTIAPASLAPRSPELAFYNLRGAAIGANTRALDSRGVLVSVRQKPMP
jgi:hypothetical protein